MKHKMVDIHTHILPGMDDGADSVDTSIAMLREQARQGVAAVVLTPHFYRERESMEHFLARRERALARLQAGLEVLPQQERETLPQLILGIILLVTFLMDRQALKGKEGDRKKMSVGVSLAILVLAVIVAWDGLGANGVWIPLQEQLAYVKDGATHFVPFTATWLDFMDCLSEGIMMPLGAILMSVMVCWDIKPQYVIEEIGAPMEKKWLRTFYKFSMRFIVPVVMLLVLLGQIDTFFGLGIF